MTAIELINALRSLLQDENAPYKWADSAMIRYLNESEEQACRRAHLLIDANTASICVFSVSASVASYLLHSKIIQIRRLAVDSATIPLTQTYRDEMDRKDVAWMSLTGRPEAFIHEANNELLLIGIPQSVDTARMVVARLPLANFSNGSGETPEIDPKHHNGLLDWAMHRAYEKRDPDTQNIQASQFYETKFTVMFGPLPTAKAERLKRTLPRNMSARTREFGT